MSQIRLEARHVSRAFGNIIAVDDVSLALEAGQVVVLLGQSGSGKSTLLRILAGLEGLDKGEVLSGGSVVANQSFSTPPEQRGLGMVFQDYALFPHLTAQQNVAFGLQTLGKPRAQDVAQDWLARVGLRDRAAFFPHQLSGGEQQRVALARALAPGPKAILMDEPFSGLDPHLRTDLQRTMVTTLRETGVAALVVSHDAEEAIAIADTIAIMDRGRLIQIGSPTAIFHQPASLSAARALGAVWTFDGISAEGGVDTPLGMIETKLNGPVTLAGRPEATTLTPDTNGAFDVFDVRGVGRDVTVFAQSDEQVVQAKMAASHAPAIGQRVGVSLDPKDIFVFAKAPDARALNP
jgi:iron(III) transport system ATP-binding protein